MLKEQGTDAKDCPRHQETAKSDQGYEAHRALLF